MSVTTRQEYDISMRRIEAVKAYHRLKQDRDFRLVIEEFYLKDHLETLMETLPFLEEGSPKQKALINEIKAISFFKKFMNEIGNTLDSDVITVNSFTEDIIPSFR